MHTKLSHDSESSPEVLCRRAVRLGLKGICFTDHAEFAPGGHIPASFEIEDMQGRVQQLAESFSDRLQVTFGVEVGYCSGREADIRQYIAEYPFDYVLGGVHVVDGVNYSYSDSCRRAARQGITASQFSRRYVEAMRQMVSATPIDALAHLDTPKRHGRHFSASGDWLAGHLTPDSPCWSEVCSLLTDMLKNEVVLEMNASGLRQPAGEIYPCGEILREYHRLGGRLVTLGSDSHTPDSLGYGLQRLAEKAERFCGFKQAWFSERSPSANPLHRCGQ